jgi:hypothetical protein
MLRPWTVHPAPSTTRVCSWEEVVSGVGKDSAVTARAIRPTRVLTNMLKLVVVVMKGYVYRI